MEVIRATNNHIVELADLFNQYRIFYKQVSDLKGAAAFLSVRLEHQQSILFIAVNQATGEAIGFTQLYPSFSSVSMKRSFILNDLFVLEKHRGQGAAQLLLDHAKSYAKANGAKGLELSTAMDNKQAQRLYERNGYERDEMYYHYYLTI
ncbi:GNAT family N-acetyltransferase [Paenibacillus sp. LHD-38]|uniref:GNAT family N-acetyltransferase n=1 Tax=Paenibacillus sp. LHD-38 TaxID=3072143 RepID=UPI0028100A57|nr:GNAT family N-acetyltransferase [Paenibacillus sp. LHD-38]MDQ8733610.1 GNAT family N-acetyltransferase [Paenibacillus sp. LHD-38]